MLFYCYIGENMINNLGLFITHHIFLTDNQIQELALEKTISCVGNCVPVWVDAKTGKTTEPAKEVFCLYQISNSPDKNNEIEHVPDQGYSIWIPRVTSWRPPDEINFEELASWNQEKREAFLKERDLWWFSNPRPMDAENLKKGYLRFEIKRTDLKIGRRKYSAQHMIEISSVNRLVNSLTT